MSDQIDVTIEQLLSTRITTPEGTPGELFLSKVIKRNTRKDGTLIEPHLYRRMINPICQACHVQYKQKYPNVPFDIRCSGITQPEDYADMQEQMRQENPDEEPMSMEEIREVYDISYWAEKHIVVKNDDGDLVKFEPRWYQDHVLRCTARHIVDRWGRGLGKTTCGVIKELHKIVNNKNYELLVICPADSQSEKWYNEITIQVENSPTLRDILAGHKQQPYKVFKFKNGSTIAIFTAGSASGRGANAVRSQSPRRIRAEEQDYLAEKDWEALDPLIQRYDKAKNNPSEFHGSSTPTGGRGKFWEMCNRYTRYKEFHFPINVHPDFDEEMELTNRLEAKTEDRYMHEYLAEFGDPAQGVFKGVHIDAAKKRYSEPSRPSLKGYDTCAYDPAWRYFMGVDWNGEGTGTRIRIVAFNPETKIRRCVARRTIDSEGWTTLDSITAITEMLRVWHCEEIYIDHGFGFAQDELLRLAGFKSDDPDIKRLLDVKVIDFGANLETNCIVPKRNPNLRAVPKGKEQDEELKVPTKPFMVEGAVMCMEHRLVEFSDDDTVLEEQMRAFRVAKYSVHGYPSSYKVDGKVGDHDLDAFMLAMLGIELKYGLFATKESYRRLAQISYVSTFGLSTNIHTSAAMQQKRDMIGAPNRGGQTSRDGEADNYRILYLMRGQRPGAVIGPNSGGSRRDGTIPSRTSVFRDKPSNIPRRGGR